MLKEHDICNFQIIQQQQQQQKKKKACMYVYTYMERDEQMKQIWQDFN